METAAIEEETTSFLLVLKAKMKFVATKGIKTKIVLIRSRKNHDKRTNGSKITVSN